MTLYPRSILAAARLVVEVVAATVDQAVCRWVEDTAGDEERGAAS